MTGKTRLEAYLLLAGVAAVAGFYVGERRASPPGCVDVGECSLGVVGGLAGSVAALVLTVALVALVEVAVRLKRTREQ